MQKKKMSLMKVLVISFIMAIGLSACKSDRSSQQVNPTNTATPTDTVIAPSGGIPSPTETATPSVEATPTETVTPTANAPTAILTPTIQPVDDPTPHVVWNIHASLGPDEDAQAEIQRFINEKGIECRIDFVPDEKSPMGKEFVKWFDEQKASANPPDIIAGCFWEHGVVDSVDFSEKELAPLNDYLESDKGKVLRKTYADVEWRQVDINGRIYRFPYRPGASLDNSVYLTVNDRFLDSFMRLYDGTYESLREAYYAAGDSEMQIMLEDNSRALLLALYGKSSLCFSATYQSLNSEFVNVFGDSAMKEYLLALYNDIRNGAVVTERMGAELSDKTFAFLHQGHLEAPKGFTEIEIMPDLFSTNGGITYGVSATAPHKDLAIEVLCTCYGDPEIASLLEWRHKDAERWSMQTVSLNEDAPSSVTGFIPELTLEERELLSTYSNNLSSLFSEILVEQRNGAGFVCLVNPKYPEILESIYSKENKYEAVFESMNAQFEKWSSEKKD